jgi:hypothetical protein
VPVEIKQYFYDRSMVDREFSKVLKAIKKDVTNCNMEYFLALRLIENSKNKSSRRLIGGRIISQILTNHFGYLEPIPEKTISCWIDLKRKPWNAFEALADNLLIQKEYYKIVDELTTQHMDYHISMALANQYNWSYSKISKFLDINKERVRGWIKKSRGNPVAKSFVNHRLVEKELVKYMDNEASIENSTNGPDEQTSKTPQDQSKTKFRNKECNFTPISDVTSESTISKVFDESGEIEENIDAPIKDAEINKIKQETDKYSDLEKELVYHLETIPTGVTSVKTLKSILIKHKDVSLEDLEEVLIQSEQIVKDNISGKWRLKKSPKTN